MARGSQPGRGRLVPDEIRVHYEAADEAGRLLTGFGPLEQERTRRLIRRFLPPPPAVVLDIGGGAGAYAIWLAELGYQVHLSDPVPKHVEQARLVARKCSSALASATVGHAAALAHDDETADVVVALGPLYHLADPSDRAQALAEAFRVLRPGAWFVGAAISRFTSLVNAIREGAMRDPTFLSIVEADLESGVHRNPSRDPDYFTTAYMHRPDELTDEVVQAGFGDVEIFAVEGVGWAIDDFESCWADHRTRKRLLQLVERTEQEPALMGASIHLLVVAQRP